jgi:hypothetical protein
VKSIAVTDLAEEAGQSKGLPKKMLEYTAGLFNQGKVITC